MTVPRQGAQGDQGSQGAQGDQGSQGAQGRQGNQGNMGNQGNPGFAGKAGEAGHDGEPGDAGPTGEQGRRGERGRSLTWVQTLAIFFVVLLVTLASAYRSQIQDDEMRKTQAVVTTNTDKLVVNTEQMRSNAYRSCLGGLAITKQFNAQQDALAKIERDRTFTSPDPFVRRLALARINVYKAGRISPLPVCVR